MSNPFIDNPWQEPDPQRGPRFGNAYESVNNPSYGNAYEQPVSAAAYPPQPNSSMPTYSNTGYNNAWNTESTKTEFPPQNAYDGPNLAQQQQPPPPPMMMMTPNAYQYTGTRYGNQPNTQSATSTDSQKPSKPNSSVGPDPWNGEIYQPPNKWYFWLRFVLFVASIGHLGFAAGARPYSGEDVPFYTPACFYYLFAVAVLSIIWSGLNLITFCYRRITKRSNHSKAILFFFDFFMALLWGIGVIVEVAKFGCKDGSKFCAFYNVSIFFGFLAFAGYILSLFWDIFSGCGKRDNTA